MSHDEDWIANEGFKVHYYPAIVTDDDGQRRSIWPEKWPLDSLLAIEHTRQFQKNYMSSPIGADGGYWVFEDIARARMLGVAPAPTRILVELDPAVTSTGKSDYTGIAVVAWTPPPRDRPKAPGRVDVIEVRQVRKAGAALRLDVIDTVARHNAGLVRIETNQGGDLWRTVLWGLPVPLKTVHESEGKEVRAARALDHYQRGRVGHAEGLTDYEGQLVAFPRAPHDDLVDAGGAGILYFLDRNRKPGKVAAGGETSGYAG